MIGHHLHVEEADIGKWNDESPLNYDNCDLADCEKYFKRKVPVDNDRSVTVGQVYRHFKGHTVKRGKKPLGTVKITGRPTAAIALKQKLLKKRNDRLTALEAELLEITNQAEEYIETIPKSELRIMFRLYYIDDLTWYQVALQMNQKFPKRRIKYTEDNCRMRHNRFLEKLE